MSDNNTSTVIGPDPPQDGGDWDAQCARCGSSIDWVQCEHCGGEGVRDCGCGEETCFCCKDLGGNVRCDVCDGEGGWFQCMSSPEWCEAHPLEGREKVERSMPEWYCVREEGEGMTTFADLKVDEKFRFVYGGDASRSFVWKKVAPHKAKSVAFPFSIYPEPNREVARAKK